MTLSEWIRADKEFEESLIHRFGKDYTNQEKLIWMARAFLLRLHGYTQISGDAIQLSISTLWDETKTSETAYEVLDELAQNTSLEPQIRVWCDVRPV